VGLGLNFLASCSADRKNILSKTYHNTTARYNAYFYAKERIEEIEGIVENNYDNDYNDVLNIYPNIDSVLASTYQTQIEDCIQKASLAIQRHKNSKWVDDSYILIGRARFYDVDYVNAIKTYKFVNTESEDDDARHRALVHLMRTFTDAQEYNNAVAVSDYLKKEKLNKDNQKLLYINRAYYYQVREDYNNMVQNLVKAAPMLKKKDGKGRLYFIIGQTYQMLGFDAEAFNYYKKCISSNPAYELDFYARLYMAQVTELGRSSDVKAARRLFQKLLKDKKNKEFKDKIYYEMAEFELKRNNLEEAVEYYESSIESSLNNNRQKGQSYHKLGIVYFDSLRQYETAKAYYDSAISALPKDYDEYESIKERQEILADFVTQINTIYLQDSLLALASLDTAQLRSKIEGIIADEEARRKAEEEKAERKASRARQNQINDAGGINESTSWYFGNPSAVALGQSEFKRIWGDRPLEDNWRRSSKEGFQDFDNNLEDPTVATESASDAGEINSGEATGASSVDALMAQVPSSEADKEAARDKIEIALYKLGNIYNFKLNEEENAIGTFESLLERFPSTEYEAEVLYQLYLINKNLGNDIFETYKDRLIAKYPNTTYAKLISNPNYTEESTEANEQQKKTYKIAYEYFKSANYDTANYIVDQALNTYQETVFTPRLKLLKVLITGKTEDINLYQYQLNEFIARNPDSDITPYAEDLLEASRNFLEKQKRLLGTEFVKYFEQEHYFVLVYNIVSQNGDEFTSKIEAYNDQKYDTSELKTSNLILNEKQAMIMVSGLETKFLAQKYYRGFVREDVVSENTQNSKLHKFVITKDNFNILYQSKDWEAYLSFFDKHYANGI